MTTRQTTTVPLFVDGEGMSGGKVHHSIEVVRSTWLRGRRILAGDEPRGQLISRGEA